MDHLETVTDREDDRKERIPYVIQNGWEYDQQGFLGFPERKGLNTQNLIDSGIHGLEIEELESFLQAWLFFGLLSEFAVDNPRIDIDSFVTVDNYGQIITTKGLMDYLNTWRSRWEPKTIDFGRSSLTGLREVHTTCYNPEIYIRLFLRCDLVLRNAKSVVQRHCSSTHTKAANWHINPSVAMSIMVLGETLSWALSQLQHTVAQNGVRGPGSGWMTEDDSGWGPSHLLIGRMVESRWCPRSIYILQGLMKGSVTGLYYASTFQDPPDYRKGLGHSNCSADQCVANHLEPKLYRLRHTTDGCKCSFLWPNLDHIVDILEHADIPLLHYIESPDGGRFEVVRYKLGIKFVVVSHVWSDGLGNPEGNAMVSCQIAHLNKLIAKFADFQGQTVFFWIDSLMVPIEPARARKMAIRQMFDVYAAAHWTIVLDANLMDNFFGSDYLEPAMRITISGWMKRLWTLQEGVMSRSIFFLFKDGLQDIEDLELIYPNAASRSSIAPVARSFYLNLLRPRTPKRHADIALVSSVWKAIQWRETTRQSDETLAIGRILNVDEYSLLSSLDDERMKVLLNNIHDIPPGMIFLPGKRLSPPGFRWAPKTWMVGRELEYPDPLSLPSKQSPFPKKYNVKLSHSLLTAEGLMVRYPGFRLHNYVARNPRTSFLRFPVDNSLQQWYNVKQRLEDPGELQRWQNLGVTDERNLAIICCRPRPSTTAEIALLVSIKEEDGDALLVKWQFRVFIELEVQTLLLEEDRKAFRQNPDKCCWGEELGPDQLWVVD